LGWKAFEFTNLYRYAFWPYWVVQVPTLISNEVEVVAEEHKLLLERTYSTKNNGHQYLN
jgi:hypothetical protein